MPQIANSAKQQHDKMYVIFKATLQLYENEIIAF